MLGAFVFTSDKYNTILLFHSIVLEYDIKKKSLPVGAKRNHGSNYCKFAQKP
jgi:hypothetical protein